MARLPVLCFFFLSGLTGLLYEVVWIRTAGTVIGNTTYAIGTVVGVYMGGLALGAWIGGRAADRRTGARLLLLYGLLEIGVAVTALAVPFLILASEPIFRVLWNAVGESTLLYAGLRALLVALLLIAPTTLMGATLPILSRYLSSGHDVAAREAGRAYAVNTFGGVAGTVAAGFWLIPSFGLRATTFSAAALNLAIGAACLLLARGRGGEVRAVLDPAPKPHRLALAVSAVSGFAALVYEVVWTRALILAMGSTVYAFTLVLTAFILGLAGGSAVCSRLMARIRDPVAALAGVQAAIGIAAIALLPFLGNLPIFFAGLVADRKEFGSLLTWQFLIVLLFVFVPAFVMGTVFPLACRLASRSDAAIGRSIGAVYTWNTLGSIVGSLAASFVLIPSIGLDWTAKIIACLNFGVSALLFIRVDSPRARLAALVPGAAILIALLLPAWNRHVMASGSFLYGSRKLQEFREGETEILWSEWDAYGLVTIHRGTMGHVSLRINGKVDASTGESDMVTQNLLGHLPLLHHSEPRRALIIGLGGGFTLGTATRYSQLKKIDCVEISPAVAEAVRYFKDHNDDPLSDERVNLIVGDGRNAVLFGEGAYDIIISEPSNLWLSGMASLFTRDFFDTVRDRLAPDGIFCQWIHAYRLSLEDFQSILLTYAESFPHLSLWELSTGSDYLVLGSREPLKRSYAELEKRLAGIEAGLRLKNPEFPGAVTMLGSLVADRVALEPWIGRAEIITDDRCAIEYSAPKSLHRDDRLRILAWLDELRSPPIESRLYEVPDSATADRILRRRAGRRAVANAFRIYTQPGRKKTLEAVRLLEASAERYGRDRQTQEILDGICGSIRFAASAAGRENRAPDAIKLYLSIPRSSTWYALARAELYQLQRRWDDAIRAWKETLRMKPDLAAAHYGLAFCLKKKGRMKEAREACERALKLSPNDLQVQQLMMELLGS